MSPFNFILFTAQYLHMITSLYFNCQLHQLESISPVIIFNMGKTSYFYASHTFTQSFWIFTQTSQCTVNSKQFIKSVSHCTVIDFKWFLREGYSDRLKYRSQVQSLKIYSSQRCCRKTNKSG